MNVAMIVYSHYSRDARVRRYAELLAAENHFVDIICLRENYTPKKNINLIFYPLERRRFSKLWYIVEYSLFFIFSFVKISLLYVQKKYAFIHVHNMPDFLIFTCMIPKLLGSKIILDLHDPMPEVYLSKYHVSRSNLTLQLIKYIEKLSMNFADRIITANVIFKKVISSRNNNFKNKILVIQNFPDDSIFKPKKIRGKDSNFTLMYMGTVADRYMLASAIHSVSLIKTKIRNFKFNIYPKLKNEGSYFIYLKKLISVLKLEEIIQIKDPIPVEKIAIEINRADCGILLLKKDKFTETIIPVKLLEFIKMETPVIATKTKTLSGLLPKNLIYYLKKQSPEEIANAIIEIHQNKHLTTKMIQAEKNYVLKNNWKIDSKKYLDLLLNLVN